MHFLSLSFPFLSFPLILFLFFEVQAKPGLGWDGMGRGKGIRGKIKKKGEY